MSFKYRQAVHFSQTAEQRRIALFMCSRPVLSPDAVRKPRWTFACLAAGIGILVIAICNLAIQRLIVRVRIVPEHVNNVHANIIETLQRQQSDIAKGEPFYKRSPPKRLALCYRAVVCLSCLSVCNDGALWPKGWMDQDKT